jgi:hypothetical protein
MSQIRDALKKEFRKNKAGLLERIKEHPLLSDEHLAGILYYEDNPSKITVDKLIDLYLPYLERNAPTIPNDDSPQPTPRKAPQRKPQRKTRGKTRKANANASIHTAEYVRERLHMLHMHDIQDIATELDLPIDDFHESQRSRIISLIIGKLVHRYSSAVGHNALSDAKATKVMRMMDSRWKEIYQAYTATRKSSKSSNGITFHNS